MAATRAACWCRVVTRCGKLQFILGFGVHFAAGPPRTFSAPKVWHVSLYARPDILPTDTTQRNGACEVMAEIVLSFY